MGRLVGHIVSAKIVVQISLGFGLLLLIIGINGGLFVSNVNSVADSSTAIASNVVPINNALHDLNERVSAVESEQLLYNLTIVAGQNPKATYASNLAVAQAAETQMTHDYATIARLDGNYPDLVKVMTTVVQPSEARLTNLVIQFMGDIRDGRLVPKDPGINSYTPDIVAFGRAMTQSLGVTQQIAANTQHSASNARHTAIMVVAVVVAISVLLTIGAALLIMLGVARPIARLAIVGEQLAVGDIAVDRDLPDAARGEIGRLTRAYREIIGYQRQVATAAESIARGNLSHTVEPKGESDVVGRALVTMTENLRGLIGEVSTSSEQVTTGAAQLAQATQQVGEASAQIATAIEDVARGTGEQSRSTSEVVANMADLMHDVDQVTQEAAGYQAAVAEAGAAMGDVQHVLDNATQSVTTVASAASRAASTAKEGGAAVAQTIASIESVRSAVLKSAEQVQALGTSSQEIGQIVDAIDDIASQTNLLALNAAIEAARAGEHGKGFTVVAAEVRKLAERSSSETKEITQRINAIQQQVADVVTAMAVGSSEVEKSAGLGRQAGDALQQILSVVEETAVQAVSISASVDQIGTSLTAVGAAAAKGGAAGERTAEATERMRGSATRIEGAMETWRRSARRRRRAPKK